MAFDFHPTAARFHEHFDAGQSQLAWCWIGGDMETPVSAYLKLCGGQAFSFLLESVEGGAVLGRYSVIGFDPDLIWRCEKGRAATSADNVSWIDEQTDPPASLKTLIRDSHIDAVPGDMPPMAVSGLFGFMGYDMVRLTENIPDRHSNQTGMPDSVLMRPRILAIFDNVRNMICLVTPVYAHKGNTAETSEKIFQEAIGRLKDAAQALDAPLDKSEQRYKTKMALPLRIESNTTDTEFYRAVEKAADYIRQGEIFQVVLSQRFSFDFDLPPFSLYRALRALNPSPFMVHLDFGDYALVASSPEILVRVRGGTVTIRPIAGTRKRGRTPEEDRALAEELLADPKERAEHLMLLDLGRNDVGRVAEYGSIKVTEQFSIENYSHVMHIVSNVEGKLKKELDIVDAHFAGFPAGTVSGAPKIRAMEIIDALENGRRGYYGGSMGYFSGNNEMDTCIALRTALVKDGKVHVQAGAGIVADSVPHSEYQETINKAQAIIQAAESALRAAAG
jgi:anthranilate synthase component 1